MGFILAQHDWVGKKTGKWVAWGRLDLPRDGHKPNLTDQENITNAGSTQTARILENTTVGRTGQHRCSSQDIRIWKCRVRDWIMRN